MYYQTKRDHIDHDAELVPRDNNKPRKVDT